MSNWGTNVNSPNHFIRRMSVLTIVYNNFATGAPGYAEAQKNLLGDYPNLENPKETFLWILTSYGTDGVPRHSNILELAQYSPFADFVIKVRNYFMNRFEVYKQDFGGIDGEALFIATALHSLDHAVMGELLPPRAKLVSSMESTSDLEGMATWCRNTTAGISTKLPGLVFPHFMHEAKHPLFIEVDTFARRLSPFLADLMRCCVIL